MVFATHYEQLLEAGAGEVVLCFDPVEKEVALRDLFDRAARLTFLPQIEGDLGARLAARSPLAVPAAPAPRSSSLRIRRRGPGEATRCLRRRPNPRSPDRKNRRTFDLRRRGGIGRHTSLRG